MKPTTPPPLPKPERVSLNRFNNPFIGLALVPAFLIGALFVVRISGLVRPLSVPTRAMTPAISAGDHVLMERMTYLARKPRRGDIVVFKTDGIASLPPATLFVKRVAGEPGDHLRISEGNLFINDKHVALSNALGEIAYDLPSQAGRFSPKTDVIVAEGSYFVLGDNSTNSLDSRFYGTIRRESIIGRILFCYWPPERVGGVK